MIGPSMERAGQTTSILEGQSQRVASVNGFRTALILYGSETGNAQDLAEEIGRVTQRLHFETTVLDLDSVQLRDIAKSTIVIFAISTAGQGELPQNARKFWRALLSAALKPGALRKVRFSSFGLGDSSYPRFNVAHRMLCGRLLQLGAHAFCERGEGNEQHPEGHGAGFRDWLVTLKRGLLAAFPLPEGVQSIADDEFLEPSWQLDFVDALHVGMGDVNARGLTSDYVASCIPSDRMMDRPVRTEKPLPESVVSNLVPSRALLPINGSYVAKVVKNDRVTAPDHFQDVRLLDLRVDETHHYGPGAVAVVYPKNFPQDIQEFIDLMEWQDIADRPIQLSQNHAYAAHSPSPLRHLDISGIDLTLRWLLENVLDIMAIPRRSFFASLAYFAGTSTEDQEYQKERLLELANLELIDELWDYTTRPKRTIVEVMMDFTTIKIPWQHALFVLPIMRGRQFSIASGGDLTQDRDGRTKVELLVAIADPPSPIIKYRRRYGVCTRYIATLEAGQQISISLQPGYLDVQREELRVPVVLIGPGTGVAPMRSMLYQRLAWSAETKLEQDDKRLEDDILIFGCRNESGDYFFKEEWRLLTKKEALAVITAFSRDKDKPRQYVQTQIRANSHIIREAILEKKGKIYVCGSSGNMPKGVREALLDVIAEPGGDLSKDEAEKYLDRMEKDGRYKQETW